MTISDATGRSARLRAEMVDALRSVGAASDAAVLTAMGTVARETFVPHFFSLPGTLKTGTPAEVREWSVDDGDEPVLNLVYDIERPLGIRREREPAGPTAGAGVTSTASAPRIVAAMLELSQLATGMRVLEIGTGSGYNAALLQELVGPQGQVTSVDIDSTLVAEASERLGEAGYGAVEVVAADGYFGVARRTPFDRVIATVGCGDVAPPVVGPVGPRKLLLGPSPARRHAPAHEGGAKRRRCRREGCCGCGVRCHPGLPSGAQPLAPRWPARPRPSCRVVAAAGLVGERAGVRRRQGRLEPNI